MKLAQLLNKFLQIYGVELKRYPDNDLTRRMKLLNYAGISTIFDVGANTGQYAMLMRQLGFKGSIVSFEPLSEAFKVLENNARHDKNWSVSNMAIGNTDGETFINVSANSYSSSILDMLPSHIKSAPESAYIKKENVKIAKIDSIIDDYSSGRDDLFLKIDTQGFEKNVIDGARNSLHRIKGVQMEMSLVPLYEGELLCFDMIEYMENMGFKLYSLESGFFDQESGRLLQIDGIFFKI